jgi:hypothetical protein
MRKPPNSNQTTWAKPTTSATNHAKQPSTEAPPNTQANTLDTVAVHAVAKRHMQTSATIITKKSIHVS